jgi:O-antigen/teichoic acid export membrane protein
VYSAFSRLQSNKEELLSHTLRFTQLAAAVILPLGCGLALLSHPISLLIFGEGWRGIEIVISATAIHNVCVQLIAINPEVFRAIGRPDINVKVLLVSALLYIPVYFFTAPYGLMVFCYARVAVSAMMILINLYVTKVSLNLPNFYLAKCIKIPLVGSTVMGIALYGLSSIADPFVPFDGWFKLAGIIGAGLIIYMSILWVIGRDIVLQILKLARASLHL